MTHLSLTINVTLASVAFIALATAQGTQEPPVKTKIELKTSDKDDPSLKLDPTQKLPSAQTNEAIAPVEAAPEVKQPELPAALKKLSADQLQKYSSLRDDATSYMRSVRLQEALEKLAEAQTMVGEPLAELENLRGAIFTKMRDFPTARKHFEKSVQLENANFHPKFNLAELDFVEKKWSAAIAAFTNLIQINETEKKNALAQLKEDARESVSRNYDITTRLMQFKVMICHTQDKRTKEAAEIVKKFGPYDNDTPAYYFGQAALAFVADNKISAEEWINSAKSIYPSSALEVYVDCFVEMGWISTLQQ